MRHWAPNLFEDVSSIAPMLAGRSAARPGIRRTCATKSPRPGKATLGAERFAAVVVDSVTGDVILLRASARRSLGRRAWQYGQLDASRARLAARNRTSMGH